MTISPNISALLNLIAGIAGVIVTCVGEFTTLFGAGPTAVIIGIATHEHMCSVGVVNHPFCMRLRHHRRLTPQSAAKRVIRRVIIIY